MKHFFLLVSLLLLISCSASLPKYQYAENTVIALVPNHFGDKLCYKYTGLTVFGNEEKEYSYEFNTEQLVKEKLSFIAKKNGHKFLYLKDFNIEHVSAYFTFSSWDGRPTPIKGKDEELKQLMLEKNIDVLLLNSAFTPSGNCNISYVSDIINKKGIIYSKKYYKAFKGVGLEYIGLNKGLGGIYVNFKPKSTESLSNDELEKLSPFIEVDIQNGVKDLFKELNLGEFGYEEKNISIR